MHSRRCSCSGACGYLLSASLTGTTLSSSGPHIVSSVSMVLRLEETSFDGRYFSGRFGVDNGRTGPFSATAYRRLKPEHTRVHSRSHWSIDRAHGQVRGGAYKVTETQRPLKSRGESRGRNLAPSGVQSQKGAHHNDL